MYSVSLFDLQKSVQKGDILWKKHALEKMMARNITRNDVKQTLLSGQIIE